jgi:hypothetical protein
VLTLIDKTLDVPYSYFQVTEDTTGEAFTARDIFLERELRISERTATQSLEPGGIIHARIVEMNGVCFMMGNGPQIIPATSLQDLVALRGMTPRKAAKDPVGREFLESLLLDFESRNRHLLNRFEQVDVAKLRKELGM